MMMTTTYESGMAHRAPARMPLRLLALLIVVITLIPLAICVASTAAPSAHADFEQYLMCSLDGDGSTLVDDGTGGDANGNPAFLKTLYEMDNTEDFQMLTDFKSQAGADTDTVSNLPNTLSGKNFDAVQLDILNSGNSTGTLYTPYDRFGFAGLNFTDYNGEWNWYKTYYCRANGKGYGDTKAPEDGHLNEYYKERKGHRPMDTYAGIRSSTDPRVQRKSNQASNFVSNWNLNIANFLFTITKTLTALVSLCMELSLTDMAQKLGITDFVQGTGGNKGLYSMLFNNLFLQLMCMMMTLTFVGGFVKFAAKGQMRAALGGIGTAFMCLFLGLVMMADPVLFINLPNTVGMIGQGLLLQGISAVSTGSGTEFCKTAGGSGFGGGNVSITGNITEDETAIAKHLSDASSSVRRNLECEYYVMFALQPYALGQYGTDYNNMWAQGHAESGGATLGNTMSSSYTGSAPVPLGKNKVIYNWLIYQISTQTNRHVDSATIDQSTGKMTKPEKGKQFTSASQYESQLTKADGANTDWWRVVDALANYKTDDKGQPDKSPNNHPVSEWNSWVGGNNAQRLLVAMLSIVFAVFGLLGPIAIGLSVIAYAVGSVFIMGFAPVALTFGMWAGHGQRVLKGWAQLLFGVVLKRIVMGFVFMLLTVFMIKITAGVTGIAGYFNAMLLICLVSYAIAKNRNMIASMLGDVHLSDAMDMSRGARQGTGALRKVARATGQTVGSGVVGGIGGAAKDVAGNNHRAKGFTKGAARAMKRSVEHASYQTQTGREYAEAQRKMDRNSNLPARENVYCDRCGRLITEAGGKQNEYVTGADGSRLCPQCANLERGNVSH